MITRILLYISSILLILVLNIYDPVGIEIPHYSVNNPGASCIGCDAETCYSLWGVNPDVDLTIYEGAESYVQVNKPVEFLGEEFTLWFTYPILSENHPIYFLDHKIDSFFYHKKLSKNLIVEAVKIFNALQQEYGTPDNVWQVYRQPDVEGMSGHFGSSPVEAANIQDWMEERIKKALMSSENTKIGLVFEWYLIEKTPQLESEYIKKVNEVTGKAHDLSVKMELMQEIKGNWDLTITYHLATDRLEK